jgi:hypothetical protein
MRHDHTWIFSRTNWKEPPFQNDSISCLDRDTAPVLRHGETSVKLRFGRGDYRVLLVSERECASTLHGAWCSHVLGRRMAGSLYLLNSGIHPGLGYGPPSNRNGRLIILLTREMNLYCC